MLFFQLEKYNEFLLTTHLHRLQAKKAQSDEIKANTILSSRVIFFLFIGAKTLNSSRVTAQMQVKYSLWLLFALTEKHLSPVTRNFNFFKTGLAFVLG